MPITNGYATLAEVKTQLNISDVIDDTFLENLITAVSREIDNYTHRRFYAATQTRYFTPEYPDLLYVDDLLSVTTLKTDEGGDGTYETSWATTDYHLEPFNAALESQTEPYTQIRRSNQGRYWFPSGNAGTISVTGASRYFFHSSAPIRGPIYKGVEIAGSWGYSSSTPPVVNQACLIQSARLSKRREAPFGVAGSGEFGSTIIIARLDPDVKLLLEDLVKKSA